MKLYVRFELGNTPDNADKFVELMKDTNAKKITLFATQALLSEDVKDEYTRLIGPYNNLPLMSACVEYLCPGVGTLGIVVDGLFLTAARIPRYNEVRYVLDEAERLDKVYFSRTRTSFTVCKDAKEAFAEMASLESSRFTGTNRHEYFGLLSHLSEEKMRDLG